MIHYWNIIQFIEDFCYSTLLGQTRSYVFLKFNKNKHLNHPILLIFVLYFCKENRFEMDQTLIHLNIVVDFGSLQRFTL